MNKWYSEDYEFTIEVIGVSTDHEKGAKPLSLRL